jgi:glycosyltransferase involved in cell wall biosynthesis
MQVRTLSIAAPAYNEAEGIAPIVEEWVDYLSGCSTLTDFEVVICNDGSKDQTATILDQLAAKHPPFKPVHHLKNQGAAAALNTAIKHTSFDWVLLLDSDGQYAISDLPRFIDAVEKSGERAAIGVRTTKHDSLFAKFGSWSSGWFCNVLHGTAYRDFNCAFKLVQGDLLRGLTLEAKGLNYAGEISSKLIERGVKMAEIEVVHHPRVKGRSSAQSLKAACHRILFVAYLGFRQFLLRQQVLQSQTDHETKEKP